MIYRKFLWLIPIYGVLIFVNPIYPALASDNSLYNGERGIDGKIFCDVQYQEEGEKGSCYDRFDNQQEFCEKYGDLEALEDMCDR